MNFPAYSSASSQRESRKRRTMLIKEPRPPEFPPPVIYHQHQYPSTPRRVTPAGLETYTSHLRLEHELDNGTSGRVNNILLSTLSSSSILVEELLSVPPLERGRDIPWHLLTWPYRRAAHQLYPRRRESELTPLCMFPPCC